MGRPNAPQDSVRLQHQITLTRGFYLGKYEVTRGQWESAMGTAPWDSLSGTPDGPNYPANNITWDDAQQFIRQLNTAAGDSLYRLPTEAEWEYACRAGTTSDWWFSDDEHDLGAYAWYRANAWNVGEGYPHEVGQKLPNPWGLHDMYGNVKEYCQDYFSPTYYAESPPVDPQHCAECAKLRA